MPLNQFPKSPNKVHPTIPSAVGSRESIAQEGRDKIVEQQLILDETYDKVLNHIQTKLPQEVLKELDIMGGLKEKLLAAQAALLDAGVADCNRFDLRGDVTPFIVVMQLDAQGRVRQTWRQGGSPLAICLERYVRDRILVPPPKAPFHASLEISFGR